MEKPPLISVALCTYNGERFLMEQMDSLLNQSYRNLEIIIVDDCSSDNTLSILNPYLLDDQRVKVIVNELNLGYNKNFEKALNLCTGELIAICDQDDIWDKDKIQIQFDSICDHQLVYHDSEFIDSHGRSMNKKISDKFNFYRGDRPEPFVFLNCVSGHSILMKRSLLQRALPFPKGFHYDQWLAFVAAANGTIEFVNQPLVKYRQHDLNNTDILALRTEPKTVSQRVELLQKESNWLRICSDHLSQKDENQLHELYQLSLKRNSSLFNLSFGLAIWKRRSLLLFLLKKGTVSKFFYVVRKVWGVAAKKLI